MKGKSREVVLRIPRGSIETFIEALEFTANSLAQKAEKSKDASKKVMLLAKSTRYTSVANVLRAID